MSISSCFERLRCLLLNQVGRFAVKKCDRPLGLETNAASAHRLPLLVVVGCRGGVVNTQFLVAAVAIATTMLYPHDASPIDASIRKKQPLTGVCYESRNKAKPQ
ncbi:hypothetical protein [Novipirellula rosea]|uniref:hypothetical protein n=1 Tax=Novipirellula rosea TaxID=1031540 RepID=UPI0031EDEB5C